MKKHWIVVRDEEELCDQFAREIEKCAQHTDGIFRVGLSGGSLVKYLCDALQRIKTIDFSKWHFYFCDERYVEATSSDSTFGEYKRLLLPHIPTLSLQQFQAINLQLPLAECAADYEQRIRNEFNVPLSSASVEPPAFDLLLLGMGPDGHTCSLFPGHPLLHERDHWIASIDDSPKSPPQRITMTLPLINAAKCCLVPIYGSAKADMVKRAFVDKEIVPITMVAPSNGTLILLLDQQAHNSISISECKRIENL